MNTEEVKARLKEKLTDAIEIENIHSRLDYYDRSAVSSNINRFSRSPRTSWDKREAMRIKFGIYRMSAVLTSLNERMPVYAHVSTEDDKLVAFTPDRQAGEADRQIKISIGRLLSRCYPCLSDNKIREKVEQHNSEINPQITFLEGMEIVHAYLENGGTAACMNADSQVGNKNWTAENSPALAYVTPGVRMAVMRNEKGSITARSMIVELNGRKEFIRCYGNPVLKNWLLSQGYVLGTWQGVTLNRVILPYHGSDYKLVVPYLDSRDGITDRQTCSVAYIDGKVLVCTTKQLRALNGLGYTTKLPGTAGFAYLQEYSSDSTAFKCPITGRRLSPLTDEIVDAWVDGKKVQVCGSVAHNPSYVKDADEHYIALDEAIQLHGSWFLNDATYMADKGYTKLDADLYPQDQGWRGIYRTETTADGKVIRNVDAVRYVTQEGLTYKHSEHITKKDVRLAGTPKTYAAPGVPILRTRSGAKVTMLTHDIKKMYDGTYDYARGKDVFSMFGDTVWVEKNLTTYRKAEIVQAYGKAKLDSLWSTFDESLQMFTRKKAPDIRARYADDSGMEQFAGLLGRIGRRRLDTYAMMEMTLAELKAWAPLMYLGGYSNDFIKAQEEVFVSWLLQKIAEMEAVEAPHYCYAEVAMPEVATETPELATV